MTPKRLETHDFASISRPFHCILAQTNHSDIAHNATQFTHSQTSLQSPICGWLELHCTSELTILAWVAGEKVAKELFSRTLTRLCIVVPTVAVAASVCTLTCAVFAVASSSARLLSMRSATFGWRRPATAGLPPSRRYHRYHNGSAPAPTLRPKASECRRPRPSSRSAESACPPAGCHVFDRYSTVTRPLRPLHDLVEPCEP